jgi:hypothetical protein
MPLFLDTSSDFVWRSYRLGGVIPALELSFSRFNSSDSRQNSRNQMMLKTACRFRQAITVIASVLLAGLAPACQHKESASAGVAVPSVTVSRSTAPLGSPLDITYKFVVANDARFDENYQVMLHVGCRAPRVQGRHAGTPADARRAHRIQGRLEQPGSRAEQPLARVALDEEAGDTRVHEP